MGKYWTLNCFFTFYILTWEAVQVLVLNFDGAARISMLLATIIFFGLLMKRKKLFMKPVAYYFIWLVYAFVNSSVQGITYFENSHYLLFVNIFLPFVFFWMVMNESLRERIVIHNTIIFSLTVYLAIAVVFGAFQSERLGSELNANSVGLRAAFLLFFIILKFAYHDITLRSTLLLTIFPLSIAVLTGSRTSYGVVLILFFAFFYLIRFRLPKRVRLLFLVTVIGGFVALNSFVLTSTELGERISTTTTQSAQSVLLTTGTNWDYLGDRGLQYVLAGPIIRDNLIFGIGLRNFLDYSTTGTVLHSEYLIHLCECGLIGFILYFFFQYWVGRNLYKTLKQNIVNRNVTVVYLAGFVAMLFLSWVTRVSYYPFYFGFFGMAVGHIFRSQIIKSKSV